MVRWQGLQALWLVWLLRQRDLHLWKGLLGQLRLKQLRVGLLLYWLCLLLLLLGGLLRLKILGVPLVPVGRISLGPRRGLVYAVTAVELGLVLLLPLHASVLEPDLDLPLREAERVGDLDPPPTCQVAVEVELLLQLQGLVAGVGRPLSFRLPVLIDSI